MINKVIDGRLMPVYKISANGMESSVIDLAFLSIVIVIDLF